MTDAVEKGFSVPERRRIFHERLPVGNIDSGILHLGFYYCPSWMVHRSLVDFFNSIDPQRTSARAGLMLKVLEQSCCDDVPLERAPSGAASFSFRDTRVRCRNGMANKSSRPRVTGHNVRYVLVWGIVGVIVAFAIVYFLFFR
jgi:hypothetical protein